MSAMSAWRYGPLVERTDSTNYLMHKLSASESLQIVKKKTKSLQKVILVTRNTKKEIKPTRV